MHEAGSKLNYLDILITPAQSTDPNELIGNLGRRSNPLSGVGIPYPPDLFYTELQRLISSSHRLFYAGRFSAVMSCEFSFLYIRRIRMAGDAIRLSDR